MKKSTFSLALLAIIANTMAFSMEEEYKSAFKPFEQKPSTNEPRFSHQQPHHNNPPVYINQVQVQGNYYGPIPSHNTRNNHMNIHNGATYTFNQTININNRPQPTENMYQRTPESFHGYDNPYNQPTFSRPYAQQPVHMQQPVHRKQPFITKIHSDTEEDDITELFEIEDTDSESEIEIARMDHPLLRGKKTEFTENEKTTLSILTTLATQSASNQTRTTFPCTIGNCKKIFSQKENLHNHMKSHKKQQSYEYDYDYVQEQNHAPFIQRNNLIQLKAQKRLQAERHQCLYCKKDYAQRNGLLRHVRDKHS